MNSEQFEMTQATGYDNPVHNKYTIRIFVIFHTKFAENQHKKCKYNIQ